MFIPKDNYMPAGQITLKVQRDKDCPNVDDIFSSLRNEDTITIKAICEKESAWRPQGFNLYEIQVMSIELIYEYPKKGEGTYVANGILISMNGDPDNYPDCICKPHKSDNYPVKLYFEKKKNRMSKITFHYEEYLTL